MNRIKESDGTWTVEMPDGDVRPLDTDTAFAHIEVHLAGSNEDGEVSVEDAGAALRFLKATWPVENDEGDSAWECIRAEVAIEGGGE